MGVVKVTDTDFSAEVEDSTTPVLVDFWAEWCGPCRMMNPILEEFSNEHASSMKVAKLNVDENPQIAQKYQIMSLPTMMVIKDGQPVKQLVGAMSKQRLEEALSEWVNTTA